MGLYLLSHDKDWVMARFQHKYKKVVVLFLEFGLVHEFSVQSFRCPLPERVLQGC
jgi:hypothetical protein